MKLIKLQNKFILVSDEDWAKGDWYYTNLGNIYQDTGKFLPEDDEEDKAQFTSTVFKRKIIAGIPELPEIDFSILSEEDCKRIGWVDVEKLCEELYPYNNTIGFPKDSLIERIACKRCFKQAQSLNDKMFSLEDMKRLFAYAHQIGMNTILQIKSPHLIEKQDNKVLRDEYIQSLQQTVWAVEVEMEYQDMHGMWFTKPTILSELDRPSRPKITNNSIKVIKIL